MKQPFDLNEFLHCPQGPRLEGDARADACRVLAQAIMKGRVMTAAKLLMQDPSLIFEKLEEGFRSEIPVVMMAHNWGLDVLALFALEHGMPVSDPSFGYSSGLLEVAVHDNLPDLVGCALLYRADPNNLTAVDKGLSLLEVAINRTCLTAQKMNSSEFIKALQITHMLLEAGADPMLPDRANNTIYSLCITPWQGNKEFNRLFTEVIKRASKIRKRREDDPSLVLLAAQAGNLDAAKQLIAAGVPFNTKILYASLDAIGKSEDIPAFAALLEEQVRAQTCAASPATSTPAEKNVAPEGFLQLPHGQRLTGIARTDACRLLDMAITRGCFITVTKILSMDSSLIMESVGENSSQKLPAIQKAITAGMTALVPFALTHGVAVDDPVFGAPGGLLDRACSEQSSALASYALLYNVNPNSSGTPSLLSKAFNNVPVESDHKSFQEWFSPIKMLLEAGARMACAEEREAVLVVLSTSAAGLWESEMDYVLAKIVNREGRAHVDLLADGRPILSIAAEKNRIQTVKALVAGGANTDPAFLGSDLLSLVKAHGGGEHLPALAALLIQGQIGREQAGTLTASVTIVGDADPGQKRNLRDIF